MNESNYLYRNEQVDGDWESIKPFEIKNKTVSCKLQVSPSMNDAVKNSSSSSS
jgi:hypothetical protein